MVKCTTWARSGRTICVAAIWSNVQPPAELQVADPASPPPQLPPWLAMSCMHAGSAAVADEPAAKADPTETSNHTIKAARRKRMLRRRVAVGKMSVNLLLTGFRSWIAD